MVYQDYVTLQVLISLDVAVADVIEKGIMECNREGAWLENDYFVTNTEIPGYEKILFYLRQAREHSQ